MRNIILLLFIAMPLAARPRAVHTPNYERIVWIAAHPDDESVIAPLLAQKCVLEHADCTLLVLSRGEAGDCKLPGGCPDLGGIRSAEMVAAGALLHAQVIQWSLPDVFDPETAWPATAADDIAAVIAARRPDTIYTFDPNHGSSCHPAHRYTAELTLAASGGVPVTVLETWIERDPAIAFLAATRDATAFDARRLWEWIVADLEVHRSQFAPEEVDAIRRMPSDQQRVWLMNASALATAHYDHACN